MASLRARLQSNDLQCMADTIFIKDHDLLKLSGRQQEIVHFLEHNAELRDGGGETVFDLDLPLNAEDRESGPFPQITAHSLPWLRRRMRLRGQQGQMKKLERLMEKAPPECENILERSHDMMVRHAALYRGCNLRQQCEMSSKT